jgi:CNT family concentrative nucleoside transporter
LQAAVAFFMFAAPPLRAFLAALSTGLDALQAATLTGSRFVFGYLAGGPAPFEITHPEANMLLAFGVFPLLIVVSTLSALLWRWGILEVICRGLGLALQRLLGLSGALGLSTASNIFLGMIEAPLVIRPYLARMTKPDLFLMMTTGLASIAGTVMALYATFLKASVPDAAGHILVAAFMSAPGSIAIARIMAPPLASSDSEKAAELPVLYRSSMDAFTRGVQDGVMLLIQVVAMLLAAVACVALANAILTAVLPAIGGAPVTLGRIFGWIFAPLMWLLGMPWSDAPAAGALMGTKTALNELIAYLDLSHLAPGAIQPRTRIMLIYALCGFANFGSVAIMIGGMSSLCPERREDIVDLGLRALLSGTLTNMMNGALIGLAPLSFLHL